IENLCISRGTLTEKERIIINGHMVQTIKMLEQLPFPRNLRRVPEYAGGHHEKRDGTGYPKGIYADEMSVPARIMVIADVFEALTSSDRPYKKPKSLSETMKIMGFLKRDNHLDPDLFDLFVKSGMYRKCGELFLTPEQLDAVDEAALLALKPKPFEPAATEIRAQRWREFLPQYRDI
ncbi:MAG TPA: HD domain-containing phosphohydrolase, partial [Burkholderiales bacterium]|nr:HD domain-containing phosphohydrolase [Burkholderiales bacterium]